MEYNNANNIITISGRIVSDIKYSHEVFGEKFYEFTLAVKRASGTEDMLPICVSAYILNGFLDKDDFVTIKGQIRSYNKVENEKNKLILTVFAQDILPYEKTVVSNSVELSGYICKKPVYRVTPLGREVCDIMIALNRQYNKSDYVPCIVWGRNARFTGNLAVGEHIKVIGRLQSRNYEKKLDDETTVTKTVYEVSVSRIEVVEQGEKK